MSARQIARGIDHIGLTVADIDAAERFLVEGLGAQFIYEVLGAGDPPFAGPVVETGLAIPAGSAIRVIRMYKLGHGPGIELFQYQTPEQRPALRACDLGWQHIALYVDDIEHAVANIVAAGGTQLGPIMDLPGIEGGTGNKLCYTRAPFGALIELLTYPSEPPYTALTPLRRWTPSTQS